MSSLHPRRALRAAALSLLLSSRMAGADAAPDWNLPAPDWYEGPVRYLLTHDEGTRFRSLKTEAERTRFIEDFWVRRDEDPSTPVNEFEIRFRKRVEDANRLFLDAPYPGWKTDRGKLYLLLGPPDEIREGENLFRGGRTISYLIWIYREPRFEGMERGTEVRFVREGSGEFKMSDRVFLDRVERAQNLPRTLAFQATAAQKPPEPRQLLDTIVASQPTVDPGRFRTHYDFFKASDGSTSVVATVGVKVEGTAGVWKVYARLTGGSASYDLVEPESFRTGEAALALDGFRLYQGRISVPPGSYTVTYAIREEATGKLSSLSERLLVPDFSRATFSLSGITLVARLEPAEKPELDQPFVVGRLLVVPKPEPVFKTGADFGFYFQVYGPRPDPETGEASLDLTYRFYQAAQIRKTGEVTYSPLGKPLVFEKQSGQVHGYTFPLTGWPAGEFKLQVTVRDRTSNAIVEGEAKFSVR